MAVSYTINIALLIYNVCTYTNFYFYTVFLIHIHQQCYTYGKMRTLPGTTFFFYFFFLQSSVLLFADKSSEF